MKKLALALLIIAVLPACNNHPQGVNQGYVEGDYLYVSSTQGGKIVMVRVNKGDRVQKDALLFELDPEPEQSRYLEAEGRYHAAEALFRDKTKGLRPPELAAIEASISRAEAALTYSQKEFERVKDLRDKNAVPAERYDAAESAYSRDRAAVAELRERLRVAKLGARSDQVEAARKDRDRAKAVLDQAVWMLDQKKGTAPVSALVTDVLYQEGELVPPGLPVIVLLPPDKVKARFFVPEEALSSLRTGQQVQVTVDGSPDILEGKIEYISSQAEYTPPFIYSKENRAKLVFMVEASFQAGDAETLNPGQPLEIRIMP